MCVTVRFMELWATLFAGCGKGVFSFPRLVNGVVHGGMVSYGRGITNSGIYTGNGTTSHVEDLEKAYESNLIESCIDRKDKNEIYMRINPNKNFDGCLTNQ